MVRVQVRHQHDIDVLRAETGAVQVCGEPPVAVVHAEDAPFLGTVILSPWPVSTRIRPADDWNEQRPHLHRDAVLVVGADDALPQNTWHETKEAAAVHQLAAVADDVAGYGTDLEGVWQWSVVRVR